MSDQRDWRGNCYEIALAIGPGETLDATAETALAAFLDNLDYSFGAVFRLTEAESEAHELVTALPADAPIDDLRATVSAVSIQGASEGEPDSRPRRTRTPAGKPVSVFDLDSFGALVLGPAPESLDDGLATELGRLADKLAGVCRHLQPATAGWEDPRFEAMFAAMQEPVVNVTFQDGDPIIKRVNPAFEATFGFDEETARTQNLNDLVVPEDEGAREEADRLDDAALDGEIVTREVRRKTADGTGSFLFRSVPVETGSSTDYFGMYIDVTAERQRQRKLEDLYVESRNILEGRDRQEIGQRTVDAVEEILEAPLVGLYLYDRSMDALVATATSDIVPEVFGEEPDPYTDRDTIVWSVYESGDPRRIDDLDAHEGKIPGGESPADSALLYPLGDHGIMILSSREASAFDEQDFYIGRLLSTLVETALDRATREEGLTRIQQITRESLTAETIAEMAEDAMESLPEALDLPLTGMWEYNPAKDRLEPLAATEHVTGNVGMPTFDRGTGIVWTAFAERESKLVSDVSAHEDAYNRDSPIESELLAPIGDFGILAAGATHTESFTELERTLLESLATNLNTAVRLINRRRELELLDQVIARVLRHNMRNELTAITGYAEYIEANSEGELAATAERINERCDRLDDTVSHTREMRQVVQYRDESVTLALDAVLEEAIATVRQEFPAADVVIDFDGSVEVVAHPSLSVAFRHLIRNAIQHNSADTPEVHVAVRTADDGPIVEIADNGPGIPEAELDILQQYGESALQHGSGTGLWIVDRVIDYSNASIEFDVTDEGTTVTLAFTSR